MAPASNPDRDREHENPEGEAAGISLPKRGPLTHPLEVERGFEAAIEGYLHCPQIAAAIQSTFQLSDEEWESLTVLDGTLMELQPYQGLGIYRLRSLLSPRNFAFEMRVLSENPEFPLLLNVRCERPSPMGAYELVGEFQQESAGSCVIVPAAGYPRLHLLDVAARSALIAVGSEYDADLVKAVNTKFITGDVYSSAPGNLMLADATWLYIYREGPWLEARIWGTAADDILRPSAISVRVRHSIDNADPAFLESHECFIDSESVATLLEEIYRRTGRRGIPITGP